MTATDLIILATKNGIHLRVRDKGGIGVSPREKVDDDFLAYLREHKDEVIQILNEQDPPRCPGRGAVPPADLPLNTSRSAPAPEETRAVVDYVARQITDDIGPDSICHWCLLRERAYWERLHRSHEACTYAACRDLGLWQQGVQTEGELIDQLQKSAGPPVAAKGESENHA